MLQNLTLRKLFAMPDLLHQIQQVQLLHPLVQQMDQVQPLHLFVQQMHQVKLFHQRHGILGQLQIQPKQLQPQRLVGNPVVNKIVIASVRGHQSIDFRTCSESQVEPNTLN